MTTVTPSGELVTLIGFDPSGNIIPLQVDASGFVRAHVETAGVGSGTMLTPSGKLVTPVGFDPTGIVLPMQVTADGYLRVTLEGFIDSDHYTLEGSAAIFSPADGTTYYVGHNATLAPQTSVNLSLLRIPFAATMTFAMVRWIELGGVAGSNENISMYIRRNNTADTLIATLGNTAATKEFINSSLSIAFAVNDFFEVKMVSPNWGTNPTNVYLQFICGFQI
jgi:hypothetical protein